MVYKFILHFTMLVLASGCVKLESLVVSMTESGSYNRHLPTPSKEPVAKIYEFSGRLGVKYCGDANWIWVSEKLDLYPGDKLFTTRDAKARIEYYNSGATLTLNSLSFFVMDEHPPSFTQFKRRSGYANKTLANVGGKGFESTISKPEQMRDKNVNSSEPKKPSTNLEVGVSLQRDVKRIPVLEPAGQLRLYAAEYPVEIKIVLEREREDEGLWYFVWNAESTQTEPVSIQYLIGNQNKILIPFQGKFMIQVITVDESQTTQPIFVHAKLRTKELTSLFEADFEKENKTLTTWEFR